MLPESSKNTTQIIPCCAWNVGGHKYFFTTTKLHFNCGVKSHFLAALCHEFLNHHQSNYQKITSDKNVDYDYFKYAKLIPTSNTVWICVYLSCSAYSHPVTQLMSYCKILYQEQHREFNSCVMGVSYYDVLFCTSDFKIRNIYEANIV